MDPENDCPTPNSMQLIVAKNDQWEKDQWDKLNNGNRLSHRPEVDPDSLRHRDADPIN
jgi:hypothetical protein